MNKPDCIIPECNEPQCNKRGWCTKHYTRWIRNGDPLIVKQIRGDNHARFESYVDRSAGPEACHLWTGNQCTGGYGQIKIKDRLELVHVVAWEFENGPKPSGIDLDHVCHNQAVRNGECQPGICKHRLCVNLMHIIPKTRSQHRADTQQWEMLKGSAHPKAKLNENQVKEIRQLLAAKIATQNQIAKWYNVSPYVISQIKLGKSWSWLT